MQLFLHQLGEVSSYLYSLSRVFSKRDNFEVAIGNQTIVLFAGLVEFLVVGI
jgi:hypothetical protein